MLRMHWAACLVIESEPDMPTMIDVAIRFDDPSVASDHALERSILSVMGTHHVKATFAVVPRIGQQTLHQGSVSHLVEAHRAGQIEIAQHGFNHESHDLSAALPSEFSGLGHAAQFRKILDGRKVIEQVFSQTPAGFVPPFNTFDHSTAGILSDTGFRYLSAGSEHGVIRTNLVALLPRTCQMSELKRAVTEARRRPYGRLVIVAVLHHHDFREFGHADAPFTLNGLSRLLLWLSQQTDVHVNTLSQLAEKHSLETWRKAVERFRWVQRQHWRVRAFFPNYCLMTRPLFNYPRPVESLLELDFFGDDPAPT